jgi:hypothetical protein
MMDALARLYPVTAALLGAVDEALATLGAPATHPVWRLLAAVGATPGDVAGFVADLEPSRQRAAATALRGHGDSYANASIPTDPPWEGETSLRYAVVAAAVRDHLSGEPDSMSGRLRALASYVDSVADWQQSLRDAIAGCLAQAMTSSQAVTLHGRGRRTADPSGLSAAVIAAADIGAAVLEVARDAATAGQHLVRGVAGLDELPYRAPALPDPVSSPGPIRLH